MIGKPRDRRAAGRRHPRDRGRADRARRRTGGRAAAEIAAVAAARGTRRPRLHRPRQSVRRAPGVLVVDKDAIDRLNRVDEAITFATLAAYKPVVAGEMIATVKIIPFAVAVQGATPRSRRRAAPRRWSGRALSHAQGRRRLDRAAGPRRQGHRQDHCR